MIKKLFRRVRSHHQVNRSTGGNAIIFIFLAIMAIFTALPMIFTIGNAFKPLDELWLFPPKLFPQNPTLSNFTDLFTLLQSSWVPMSRYFFNTVFITVMGTAGEVIFASMCAYALAKHNFPGSKVIFAIIVYSLLFTTAVTGIPNYLTMVSLNWIDTYYSIIVPAMGTSLGLYLMKQFIEQLPDVLIEAAKIDGTSELGIFWKIVMPNVKPAWLTVIIFSMQGLWSIGSSTYIYSEDLKTLAYSMGNIVSGGIARAGVGSAVTVIMISVPIITFVVTQSNVMETMSTSGMKD